MQPFALERYFAQHEFSARHLFSSSDCEAMRISALLDLATDGRSRLEQAWLGYTQAPGAPELREQIASLYETISPDEVIVFSGAEEAIYAFARTMTGNGDRVVVQTPAYQSLYEVSAANGAQILRWEADPHDGWRPPLDALRSWAQLKLRAVVINTPHNPTGFHFSPDDFAAVVQYAERAGAILFCDEVYRMLEFGAPRLPAACDASRSAVSLGVMSKSFGLAGLRIGWIATHHRGVREAVSAYKDYLTICASAPSEVLATIALEHREALLERNVALARENSTRFDTFTAGASGFSWVRPHAGPIAFARIPEHEPSAADLAREMVEAYGIMMLPSTTYGFGDRHVRVGYGRANFAEVLSALERALRERDGKVRV